jgi:hypothetical protein
MHVKFAKFSCETYLMIAMQDSENMFLKWWSYCICYKEGKTKDIMGTNFTIYGKQPFRDDIVTALSLYRYFTSGSS